jgi:hypothetical protein
MNREQAIELANSKWLGVSYYDCALFQLCEERPCMPLDVYQEALSNALGHPVLTHELEFRERLKQELVGERDDPTLNELINLLPPDKRYVLAAINSDDESTNRIRHINDGK